MHLNIGSTSNLFKRICLILGFFTFVRAFKNLHSVLPMFSAVKKRGKNIAMRNELGAKTEES